MIHQTRSLGVLILIYTGENQATGSRGAGVLGGHRPAILGAPHCTFNEDVCRGAESGGGALVGVSLPINNV